MTSPTRVLVTGGAGFIASHVVDRLIEKGYEVAVVDSLETGNKANLNPKAEFHDVDICDEEALSKVFASFRPTIVDHHAAQISVTLSSRKPAYDAMVNVVGSINVHEAARAAGVEHFVFASTGGALYGDPAHVPADEDTPIAPLAPYGASKASFETYLRMYHDTYGLSYTALRYSNVYGPRQTPEGEAGVIAIFTNKMLSGQTPTIFGDGEQQRDFVYVGDVAAANLIAIERRLQGPYNVGTGELASVNRVTSLLREAIGFKGDVVHAEERPGEVRRVSLDAGKLTKETGWRPSLSLEEGIRRTVEHQRAVVR